MAKDLANIAAKHQGGECYVEMERNHIGLVRDPAAPARISRVIGLHILMGCGFCDGFPRSAKTESTSI